MKQNITLICAGCGITQQRSINIPQGTHLADKPPSFLCTDCTRARRPISFDRHQFYEDFDCFSALREARFPLDDRVDGYSADEIGWGTQIIKPRRPERRKEAPSWVMNEKQLSQLEKELDRERRGSIDTARAMKALRLYFKVRLSMTEVARELEITVNAAKCLVKRLVERGNAFFRPLTDPYRGSLAVSKPFLGTPRQYS